MRNVIYILFLFLFLITSCGRKSGRNVNHGGETQSYSNSENPKNTVSRDQSTRIKPSSIQPSTKNTATPLSGSDIFEKYNEAVFMVFTFDGINAFQGSGFVVKSKGIAVSNYHVFEETGIGSEVLKFSNGDTYKIKDVIACDSDKDIIIFSIDSDSKAFPYIPISNSMPSVGEEVYAIGSPFGLENTFSSGEISQIRSSDFIQISVSIDHGSSGGALINKYGEAIGITTSGIDGSAANLNFAININVVKKYLSE